MVKVTRGKIDCEDCDKTILLENSVLVKAYFGRNTEDREERFMCQDCAKFYNRHKTKKLTGGLK